MSLIGMKMVVLKVGVLYKIPLDNTPILCYTIYEVISMKEQLIKYWERKERAIMNEASLEYRKIHFSQAFGALDFAASILDDWDKEAELVDLWNNEWKLRLEEKVYEIR